MKLKLILLVLALGVTLAPGSGMATPSTVVNLNNLTTNQLRGLAWARAQANAATNPVGTLTVQQYADKLMADACDSYDAQRIAAADAADAQLQALRKAYVDASPTQQQAARTALGIP